MRQNEIVCQNLKKTSKIVFGIGIYFGIGHLSQFGIEETGIIMQIRLHFNFAQSWQNYIFFLIETVAASFPFEICLCNYHMHCFRI